MAEILVSIIINNYNYERFLAAAIDSALAQDHDAVEVIVVDDGSTDGSRAIITGYGKRIRAVLKTNGGQGSAFNAGFAVSRGAVVNFLDADDTLEPDAARRAATALADSDLSQWMAPLTRVDAEGRPTGGQQPSQPLCGGELGRRTLAFGPWAYPVVPTSGNFWSRRFLEQVLPMPETYRVGGDEYLFPLASLYGRVAIDHAPAGCYRGHGGNAYWRRRISVADVEDDAFYFERIAAQIQAHAARLGMKPQPEAWLRRDWRQQVRREVLARTGRRPDRPLPREVMAAVLSDQTRPIRKAVLLPAVAAMLALPGRAGTALGMALLARR